MDFFAVHESTAELPLGLFWSQNIHADGLFDECLSIRSYPDPSGFRGQYCSVFFQPEPLDPADVIPSTPAVNERANMVTIFQLLNQIFGNRSVQLVEPKVSEADSLSYIYPSTTFCLPSSCTANDLGQSIAQLVGTYAIGGYSIKTVTDERYCFTDEHNPPKFNAGDITVM